MSLQRRALPAISRRILELDPGAGIVLQGSVQHGRERPDSDLDLTLVLADGGARSWSELVTPVNRGRMIRVRWPEPAVDIDINWLPVSEMLRCLRTDAAREWFLFSHGEILHDAQSLAAECQALGRGWFVAHPRVAEAWRRQNEEVRRAKSNPAYVLDYPRWADFSVRLRELVGGL